MGRKVVLMSTTSIVVAVGAFVLGALLALLTIPILVWLERRIASLIQDRIGPNRTNIFGFRLGGVVQSFADVVKLLLKEEYYPSHIKMGKWLFMLAPVITFAAALLAFMAIPFADTLHIDGEALRVQALPIDYGVFWYMAISAIGVLGIIFGGWLSHNKYAQTQRQLLRDDHGTGTGRSQKCILVVGEPAAKNDAQYANGGNGHIPEYTIVYRQCLHSQCFSVYVQGIGKGNGHKS